MSMYSQSQSAMCRVLSRRNKLRFRDLGRCSLSKFGPTVRRVAGYHVLLLGELTSKFMAVLKILRQRSIPLEPAIERDKQTTALKKTMVVRTPGKYSAFEAPPWSSRTPFFNNNKEPTAEQKSAKKILSAQVTKF